MCYDAESIEINSLRYAIARSYDAAEREALQRKLDDLQPLKKIYHHVSGFAHPNLVVFTNTQPMEPQLFYWGLIPAWAKDSAGAKDIANKTLNARGETIFEKPAFKSSAINKRCLVYLDSFYEHHHANGKTYPFRIRLKDESPLTIGGLWSEWTNKETGEIIKTVSIVTTGGNPLMTKIHNNPKAEGPRMPLILPKEKQDEWLQPINNPADQNLIKAIIKPLDESLLVAYPVGKLKGKEAVGNVPEVKNPVHYPELSSFNTQSEP